MYGIKINLSPMLLVEVDFWANLNRFMSCTIYIYIYL